MVPVRIGAGLLCDTDGTPRRHFLLMAGAGLDAHIVANLNLKLKRLLGKGAYWSAGFGSLTRRLEELDAANGSHRARCSFALASRVRNYGGDLEIALGASLLKEHFEVMLFEGSNPFRYLKYFSGVLLGTAARLRGVSVWQATEITLTPAGSDPVRVQIDGEDGGELPASLRFVPRALNLLMPPEFLRNEQARWTT
jgi:diacylglycerol kinase family enzyme